MRGVKGLFYDFYYMTFYHMCFMVHGAWCLLLGSTCYVLQVCNIRCCRSANWKSLWNYVLFLLPIAYCIVCKSSLHIILVALLFCGAWKIKSFTVVVQSLFWKFLTLCKGSPCICSQRGWPLLVESHKEAQWFFVFPQPLVGCF